MRMRIGICDSEISWHETMKGFLENVSGMDRMTYEMTHFYGENDLLQFLGEPIDLLFTNIQLKDGNGIALARRLNRIWPECQIVYVADDLRYAVDVYQTEHAYYILKEQIEEKMETVLEKTLDRAISGRHKKKKVMLSVIKGEQLLLSPEEIIYFERRKRITVVVTTIGTYEIRDNLDTIQKTVFLDEFIRCHTSYIVHLSAVRAVEGNTFQMCDGSWVPISRGYVKIVKNSFAEWTRQNVMAIKTIGQNDRKINQEKSSGIEKIKKRKNDEK